MYTGSVVFIGDILNGEMVLGEAGEKAKTCWLDIPNHFPNVMLHEFIIMPNHIHGIIEIVGAKDFSTTNNDSPENDPLPTNQTQITETSHCPGPSENKTNTNRTRDVPDNRAKYLSPLRGTSKTIGSIVRGFKIGVTKWIRQNTGIQCVWQRNYYEHIIRTGMIITGSYNKRQPHQLAAG